MPQKRKKKEESPYVRVMRHKRAQENRAKTRQGAAAQAYAAGRVAKGTATSRKKTIQQQLDEPSVRARYCNAKKKDGNKCRMAAGFGTTHSGQGRCKYHGGASPTHLAKALKEGAKLDAILLGAPKEINPLDAIIWIIQIKAGEVQWLSDRIAELDEKEWISNSIAGKSFHLFVEQRDMALKMLLDSSATAIKLGLAERAVKLAEQYGEMLANLIGGIAGDLNLSPDQQRELPHIVRKHLLLVQGGAIQGQLPAGTEELAA